MKSTNSTITSSPVTSSTVQTNTPKTHFNATFAAAVLDWYNLNTSRGMTAKERAAALQGGDNVLSYRVACYAVRNAAAAYVLATSEDAPTDTKGKRAHADFIKKTRDAVYTALRGVYEFAAVKCDALDLVKLSGVFAVRMDAPRRIKVGADVVGGDGTTTETYERRRVVVAPSDPVLFSTIEAQIGRKLAGRDVLNDARTTYADIEKEPKVRAKGAPRPEDGKAPVQPIAPRPAAKGTPRKKQPRAVEKATTGEKVLEARRAIDDAKDAARVAANDAAPLRVVK